MDQKIIGVIKNVSEGTLFESRKELAKSGIHRPLQAGICGQSSEGAESVVLSGGYEDKDFGDIIIYTGQGGRNNNTGKIIADQKLTLGNKALALSFEKGTPIRVTRGSSSKSPYAPKNGYRYDGLYFVEEYWNDKIDNHIVYRFKLSKILESIKPPIKEEFLSKVTNQGPSPKKEITTLRVIRDTKKSLEIKKFYNYTCQVCGSRLEGPMGPYAEAAHIKPIGEPHNGPDDIDNLICLCPNHHVLFDIKAFSIFEDLTLRGKETGKLFIKKGHEINKDCLKYRNEHYN